MSNTKKKSDVKHLGMSGMHTFGYVRNDCKCWEYEVRTWKVLAVGSLTCNSNRLGGGEHRLKSVVPCIYLYAR